MRRILLVFLILVVTAGLSAEWKVNEGFESGLIPADWTIIDGDDGSTWTAYENASVAYSGNWVAFSETYNSGEDNWLILPQILVEDGDEFSAYLRSWYSTEDFEVMISTSGTNANDFDYVLIEEEGLGNDYQQYTCDLSSYSGQSIYIGIHWLSDTYALIVDNVKAGQAENSNTAPEINLPSELIFDENSSITVDFSEYITDAEGDELTLTVSDNNEVAVEISGLQVTLTAEPDWFGEDVMLFYVTDGEFTSSDFLTVVVNETGGNTAPVIDVPSEFTFEENNSLTVDFSQYVYDEENDPLTLSFSDNNQVNVEINELEVTFTAEPDWFGDDVMMVYVSDGEFSDSDFLTVVVTEVQGNTPPVIDLPDSFSFPENGSLVVDFEEYISDADNDELTLSVSSNTEVFVSITGLEVEFTSELNWFGEDVMMFSISDGEFSDSDFLTVIVTEVLTPGWQIDEDFENGVIPEDWLIIDGDDGSTWTAYENSSYSNSGSWMAFSESYDSEEDNWLILPQVMINAGDELSFFARSWYSTEIFEVMLSIEDPAANDFDYELLSIEEQPSFYMQYNIDLTEYAGSNAYIGFHWTNDSYALLLDDIKLGQDPGGNTAPVINLPESISFDEDTIYNFDTLPYIFDEEGDDLEISLTGNDNISVNVTGYEIEMIPAEDWFGTETITISVTDGEYTSSDDMEITVIDIADHLLGDVDDNGVVESFDSSLILQYVVSLDPAPYAPLPWEDWRVEMADSDGNGEVNAYDAALILQYVVGIITELPAESEIRNQPESSVKVIQKGNVLSFCAIGDIYSFYMDNNTSFMLESYDDSALVAYNGAENKLAMASANKMQGCFLKLKIREIQSINHNLKAEINGIYTEILLEGNDVPSITKLLGSYPNPFNPTAIISFCIADGETGTLSIFNLKGEMLYNEKYSSGNHNYNWNADKYSSGKYYYRLKTAKQSLYGQMTLLK